MFFPRGRGEDPDGFSLVAYSDSDWAGDRESHKSTSSGMIWWRPSLISDLVKGQSVVATSSGEAQLSAAVSVMKNMILIKRALSFIGMSAKMEIRLDSSAARAMLERQGAGRLRRVEVAVLWAQQWVKDRVVVVRAEPTRTNCADLGTKVHSVARFRELCDMIKLKDRDDFEAEASKETLPVPLSCCWCCPQFVAVGKLDNIPFHTSVACRSKGHPRDRGLCYILHERSVISRCWRRFSGHVSSLSVSGSCSVLLWVSSVVWLQKKGNVVELVGDGTIL